MPFTVQHLIEDRKQPVTISPNSLAQEALELMVEFDYSQLPVVDGDGKPVGMVTGDSILRALDHFGVPLSMLHVSDALVQAKEYRPDEDLFALLDDLRDTYAVLIVDAERRLIGIVTSYDTTEYFRRRAEDMMFVEDIELTLKDYIRAAFTSDSGNLDQDALAFAIAEITEASLRKKFQKALNHYLRLHDKNHSVNQEVVQEVFSRHFVGKGSVKSLDDLTLNEYIQLLLDDSKWSYFHPIFSLSQDALRHLLDSVRETRNALAHFRGQITPKQSDQLHFCAKWLKQRQAKMPVIQTTGEKELALSAGESLSVEESLSPSESRYTPLAIWLQKQPLDQERVALTFKQIEEIVGSELPASAREHRAWWSNDMENHPQARQWWDVGWRVSTVRMIQETVVFTRIEERKKAYIEFFNTLLTQLANLHPLFPLKMPSLDGESRVTIAELSAGGQQVAKLGFAFTHTEQFRVELSIDAGNELENRRIFDSLYRDRNSIEAELEEPLSWESLAGKRELRLALYHNGSITSDTATLIELREWAVETVMQFYSVIEKWITKVGSALRQPLYDQAMEAAAAIQARTSVKPVIGLILGSGLGDLANEILEAVAIPYEEIPHFMRSTVPGHVGRLILGMLEATPIMAMQGRFHFYEGYPLDVLTLPVRVMHQLGARTLIVTNAAGGLNSTYRPGDFMLIRDHINIPGMVGANPLMGPNDERFGERFVPLDNVYDQALLDLANSVATTQSKIRAHEGVYVMVSGPTFETKAELRLLRTLGADAVGMSTLPEVLVARQMGMRVLGLSLITNIATGDEVVEMSHAEVLARANNVHSNFAALLHGIVNEIGAHSS